MLGSGGIRCAEPAALEIHIHDNARLTPKMLGQSVARLAAILGATGVSVDVRICRGDADLGCQDSKVARTVKLFIVPRAGKIMKNVRRPPLGETVVSEAGADYALIFLPTVQDNALAWDVPWPVILACAAAHEIGHLLLGANAHTARGLMKASWDRNDFVAMAQDAVHFSTEQRQAIARCCGVGRVGEMAGKR